MLSLTQVLSATFGLASAVTAGVAAYFWWRSSNVPMPDALHGFSPIGGATHVNTRPLVEAAAETGRLNKIAASWSAIAAICAGFSTFAGFISGL